MNGLGNRLPQGARAVAWSGVLIGVAAAFVALPPIGLRSPVFPVVIGLFAVTVGIGSWIRGERRIGAYAVAAGVAGFAIGYLATRSSVDKLDAVVIWGALLASTLRFATPLVFAALGGRGKFGTGHRHAPAHSDDRTQKGDFAGLASRGL